MIYKRNADLQSMAAYLAQASPLISGASFNGLSKKRGPNEYLNTVENHSELNGIRLSDQAQILQFFITAFHIKSKSKK